MNPSTENFFSRLTQLPIYSVPKPLKKIPCLRSSTRSQTGDFLLLNDKQPIDENLPRPTTPHRVQNGRSTSTPLDRPSFKPSPWSTLTADEHAPRPAFADLLPWDEHAPRMALVQSTPHRTHKTTDRRARTSNGLRSIYSHGTSTHLERPGLVSG